MLLTICIPTYNRSRYVHLSVTSIAANILPQHPDVELVVVDNASTDETAEKLRPLVSKRARVITRERHLDSAEANLIGSVEFCQGDYVWFLGDDDVVLYDTVDRMLTYLRSASPACLIFNSSTISPQGGPLSLQPVPMYTPKLQGSMATIVQAIGLTFTLAGFSNVVQKRDHLDAAAGREWLDITVPYSHVAWLMDSNDGDEVEFWNMPLVLYRQNDYSDGRWEAQAKRRGVQAQYFWSLGTARLLQRLLDRGRLEPAQVGSIFEVSVQGNRYRLVDSVVQRTFQQLAHYHKAPSSEEAFSESEMAEIRTVLIVSDPALSDIVLALDDLHTASHDAGAAAFDAATERFTVAVHARNELGPLACRFLGRCYGFDLYRTPWGHLAARGAQAHIETLVNHFAVPGDDHPDMRYAGDLEELLRLVSAAQPMMGRDTVSPQDNGSGLETQQLQAQLTAVTAERDQAAHDFLCNRDAFLSERSLRLQYEEELAQVRAS